MANWEVQRFPFHPPPPYAAPWERPCIGPPRPPMFWQPYPPFPVAPFPPPCSRFGLQNQEPHGFNQRFPDPPCNQRPPNQGLPGFNQRFPNLPCNQRPPNLVIKPPNSQHNCRPLNPGLDQRPPNPQSTAGNQRSPNPQCNPGAPKPGFNQQPSNSGINHRPPNPQCVIRTPIDQRPSNPQCNLRHPNPGLNQKPSNPQYIVKPLNAEKCQSSSKTQYGLISPNPGCDLLSSNQQCNLKPSNAIVDQRPSNSQHNLSSQNHEFQKPPDLQCNPRDPRSRFVKGSPISGVDQKQPNAQCNLKPPNVGKNQSPPKPKCNLKSPNLEFNLQSSSFELNQRTSNPQDNLKPQNPVFNQSNARDPRSRSVKVTPNPGFDQKPTNAQCNLNLPNTVKDHISLKPQCNLKSSNPVCDQRPSNSDVNQKSPNPQCNSNAKFGQSLPDLLCNPSSPRSRFVKDPPNPVVDLKTTNPQCNLKSPNTEKNEIPSKLQGKLKSSNPECDQQTSNPELNRKSLNPQCNPNISNAKFDPKPNSQYNLRPQNPGFNQRPPDLQCNPNGPRSGLVKAPPNHSYGQRPPNPSFDQVPPNFAYGPRPPNQFFDQRPSNPQCNPRLLNTGFNQKPSLRPPYLDCTFPPPNLQFEQRPPVPQFNHQPANPEFHQMLPNSIFENGPSNSFMEHSVQWSGQPLVTNTPVLQMHVSTVQHPGATCRPSLPNNNGPGYPYNVGVPCTNVPVDPKLSPKLDYTVPSVSSLQRSSESVYDGECRTSRGVSDSKNQQICAKHFKLPVAMDKHDADSSPRRKHRRSSSISWRDSVTKSSSHRSSSEYHCKSPNGLKRDSSEDKSASSKYETKHSNRNLEDRIKKRSRDSISELSHRRRRHSSSESKRSRRRTRSRSSSKSRRSKNSFVITSSRSRRRTNDSLMSRCNLTSKSRACSRSQSHHTGRSLEHRDRRCSPGRNKENGKEENLKEESLLPPKIYSWFRCSDKESYYVEDETNAGIAIGTEPLDKLHLSFENELIDRAKEIRASKPLYIPPLRKTKLRKPKPPRTDDTESSSSSEASSSEEEDTAMEELEKKKQHPDRLHEELWFNDPGEMNDGPLCRCSAKASRSGIRHGIYAGEEPLLLCDPNSNNADKLHHYRITITPNTNFLSKSPTVILHRGHEYIFEGFSMFSHSPIPELPSCKVIRFNIEYTIVYFEEKFPDNFTIHGLDLFYEYLMVELLELIDLSWKAHGDSSGCPRFHFLPRFVRDIEDDGKEILSMHAVLLYLLQSNEPLIKEADLENIMSLRQYKWQDLADKVKGMIVTCPGMKPSSIRVDQLDREQCNPEKGVFPEIIHFGVRPPQLSYAGNPEYQKAWREYVKFRHLLANKPKVYYVDRHNLLLKERRLQKMRMKNSLKRDVTIVIGSKGFYRTGIMCDVVQHAMLLPVLVCHLRFHKSLDVLEHQIGYKFDDRFLLQLALTHPSYRENFGTNPDHARNSLTNSGIRQPEYGDRRIHYMNTRKRGINTLINIMSRFGRREETASRISHNERLEFLGDAVVEFLSSIHLFFMFPNLEEGGLATYRAAIVQNQHLAVLAKKLQLEKFMLYAHGSDLCHDLELKHAMANCFEALMGALFLDRGIEVADKVFSRTLFTESDLLDVWINYPPHPLQEQEPDGDRKWITSVPLLQELQKFEESIGIEFTHIRLLARSLTHRSLGYNNLTMGSNQRLEFLGDTVLQLVASEYLYKFFPEHHEGHLSLLRSSLVNNRTQAVVCGDLGMAEYAIYTRTKVDLKTKDRADLLEAFLGALYVDKGLEYCTKFCEVCFFPRLQDFIMNQEWNDPKSKLQQCCLTLRTMDGGEPDIPLYKVIECKGPTNTRVYSVAVYFRRKRLAVGSGHSIQQAEMAAAENALKASKGLFPQLDHQKRAIEKSLKQRVPNGSSSSRKSNRKRKRKKAL